MDGTANFQVGAEKALEVKGFYMTARPHVLDDG